MKTKSNTYLSIFFTALAFLLFPQGAAHADVSSILYVQGPGGAVLVNTSLVVPTTCNVQDSTGAVHTFTGHKAPCALQAAKATGVIADFLFKDFGGLGLFLDRVNGIASGPAPDFPFWNLWRNGVFSDVGINEIVLSTGDTFQLTYGPYITGIVSIPQKASGGPVVTDIYPRRVAVEGAISFLVANQQEDGSFGHPLFTDWVAIALGAYKGNSSSAFYAKNKLGEWMKKNPIPGGSALTDFERRAMALMALGINPYTGTGTDYIQAILKEFDGQQFGNVNLVNDDIFALLVLVKAGYQKDADPVASALQFVLSSQRENGSWGDADMSAAAIQVLDLFSSSKEREQAIAKAKKYLEGKQESTGGFGNVYSTSWVLQAIAALNEDGDAWAVETDRRTPEHFLALRQALDGGLLQTESKENRIWATAYAIPAALAKSWSSVLTQFEKPSLSQAQTLAAPTAKEAEVLATVEKEIVRISQEVVALRTEVLAFATSRHIEQELDRIALETKAVQVGIVQVKIQQIAQEPSLQDLSGLTLSQEGETAPLAAEAREAVGAQGLSPQLIILIVIIGAAVFAFSGGANAIFPLLRKTFSRV